MIIENLLSEPNDTHRSTPFAQNFALTYKAALLEKIAQYSNIYQKIGNRGKDTLSVWSISFTVGLISTNLKSLSWIDDTVKEQK